MEIEEIRSTRRGEEIRRLAQSMGAERAASQQAAQQSNNQSAKPAMDVTNLSTEACNPLSGLADASTRTSQILTGLEQSFQGNSQDRNHHHRPKNPRPDQRSG